MKTGRKLLILLLITFLTMGVGGCNTKPGGKSSYKEPYEYLQPLHKQKADVVFEFPAKKSPADFGIEESSVEYDKEIKEIINVYIDSKFTISVDLNITYSADSKSYTVSAPEYGTVPLAPSKINGEDYECPSRWGLAGQYYIVQYYDLNNGKKLDRPKVTVFDIDRGEETPQAPFLEFRKSDTGFASFRWNEIESVDKYHLYYIGWTRASGYRAIENIEDTHVIYEFIDITPHGNMLMNMLFRDNFETFKYFYVIAEKDGVFSAASNLIDIESMRSSLIYSFDYKNMDAVFENPDLLPGFAPVEMCDRNSISYPLTYDTDNIIVSTIRKFFGYDENDGITTERLDRKSLVIPVYAEGTELVTHFFVDYKEENKQKIIDKVAQINASKFKAGADNEFEIVKVQTGKNETEPVNKDLSFSIFASSRLSEHLARNLLDGQTIIDLSAFNEASDVDYLLDCFFEAYYQNPLILSVNGLALYNDGSCLVVTYGQDRDEQQRKQTEIKAEVERVIDLIIKPGMSDIEKEFAINDYLCESAEYDMAALEDAMENDMIPDNSFRDSFTPYGILINKVGVCASYSSAFKLLADAVGLKSVVVTGYLNGYLPHAWNRVYIDGEWMTLDVTNNDDPLLYNALLNLWDGVSALVLVEDDLYVLDSVLDEYRASNEKLEYYRYNDKFYEKDVIAEKLAEGLSEFGFITLRTYEDLTNDELDNILRSVVTSKVFSGRQDYLNNVEVYFFMGCITLRYIEN